MSDHLPYEILVSERLQTLPIPDFADAIWSRIEARLDLELPTDGGDPPPSTPAGPADLLKGLGLSVILIAVLFFLTRSNNINTETPNDPIPIPAPSIIQPAGNDPPPVINRSPANVITAPGTITVPTSPVSATAGDSAFVLPAPVMPVIDSTSSGDPAPAGSPLLPAPDSTAKKPRGVPGIDPKDYRVVPAKKD